jgi:hypothetical protein
MLFNRIFKNKKRKVGFGQYKEKMLANIEKFIKKCNIMELKENKKKFMNILSKSTKNLCIFDHK